MQGLELLGVEMEAQSRLVNVMGYQQKTLKNFVVTTNAMMLVRF